MKQLQIVTETYISALSTLYSAKLATILSAGGRQRKIVGLHRYL